jgi:hypothetical protein
MSDAAGLLFLSASVPTPSPTCLSCTVDGFKELNMDMVMNILPL